MNGQHDAQHPQHKPFVVLTGTAKSAGPAIGLNDIGVSESAYIFRVALPGIRMNRSDIKCEIKLDGKVHIQGTVSEGGLLRSSSDDYKMMVEQLCATGPFTISFNLPGPVDPRLSSPKFRNDGVLEVVVMKYRGPSNTANGQVPA